MYSVEEFPEESLKVIDMLVAIGPPLWQEIQVVAASPGAPVFPSPAAAALPLELLVSEVYPINKAKIDAVKSKVFFLALILKPYNANSSKWF